MELREKWDKKVNWGDGVFDSLERFVDSNSENVEEFIEEEDQNVLYEGQPPDPKPARKHVDYMLEYAKEKYE